MQVIKLFWVLMLSLSLSAQAFAGALLPCQMNTQISAQSHGEIKNHVMDHKPAMDHSQMSVNSMQTMDCCLQECKCPKAVCASLALLNAAFIISLEVPSNPRLFPPSVELPNVQLNSLIRPPILS